MARQKTGCRNRGTLGASPAPLYDRVEDLRPAAERPAPGQGAARRSLEDTEMRIRRYPAPVSIQATTADQEVVCLLRRQNELLTEILGVLNAQLAVGLEQFRSGT
ncbi:hypothetical protein [Intestinimonas butyriciproducens]|uniref:hypothetical protein n=1 Tax=Intestinimonas butyriciproducens TaxID=1297617 RepID=UPI00051B4A47|nr:hypothetical protein [Intestinimonas butyriciproducens]